ncbi:hypothetical protein Dalk_4181 [Desulfatibacillum aliphaticivorans]|uniref:Uncharacterized protein n=1 Tax=Desulfatibacillum aliphaticivorans TaxID=218208 RepID=B8FMZ3_DESAL|nr:helix-turn-helix domain-containing protein [Desulfatibacillum aliphaticivorans]ACL05863.1 hypothetical protein Dalk_4181 [Desulfatibacillum aliphaticivorans]
MYQFKPNARKDIFFRFSNDIVDSERWAMLPPASKSIYPVIGVHCNKDGLAFPGQETIAILAGITPKTVRSGIEGLLRLPNFTVQSYYSNRGRVAKKYQLKLPDKDRSKTYFGFSKRFIDGGNWSQLKPGAHALFPVIQRCSWFDYDYYIESKDGELEYNPSEFFSEHYGEREYDFLDAELGFLTSRAGVGQTTVLAALEELEKRYFIEETENFWRRGSRAWKVFLTPPMIYKPEWLNEQAQKRYGKNSTH